MASPSGELHHGGEGEALLAAEALQRADLLLAEQGLDFFELEGPAEDDLPHVPVALLALELLVVLVDLAAALGAGGLELAEVAGNGVVLVGLGLRDDALGERADLGHEPLALELAALDLPELELPVAGQLGPGQLLDAEPVEEGDEREGFRAGHQLALVAMDVLLVDQAFDDGGARGRRAEAALAHGLAEFVVLDKLAGALHGGEERGFRVARRGLGLAALDLDIGGLDLLALLHGHEAGRVVVAGGFLAVNFEPAGLHKHLAGALERLALDACDAGRLQKLRRRENTARKRRVTRS